MSNIENYNEKLETIEAIPFDAIKAPSSIPVDVFLQESENLYHWCQQDKDELLKKGLELELIEDIPVRCGALREAQSRWITSRFSHEEAEKLWVEKSPEAYDFRNELLHTFRFAYRNEPVLLSRVNTIAQDYGHADMIQDLNDLSVLGKENPDSLNAINFDMSLLDSAAAMADEMSDLLGATTAERADTSKAVQIRNRAYTHLKEAVDELKAFGQFLFWKDEARLKGYSSEYYRRHRSKAEKSDDVTEPVSV